MPITNASSHGSPPDDAGHRGAFTRPEETLIEPTTGESDVPPPPVRSPWGMSWGMGMVVLAVVAFAVLLAAPYVP